ncbi:hypothetical protein [Aggregatilinea lenta]|uniref:hypothetical protein n=1 Tax=Aggregatilinea lenta TaxID=913108 RepID=UPI000E5A357B|nr:hypothetical protein [Aggregatilinea lenta]
MLKKIVLGVLFTGLIGVLIYGAINRTIAKTQSEETGQESGEVWGGGTGNGGGLGGGSAYAESEAAASEWLIVQGVVTDVSDTELVLDADGEAVFVEGRPWAYALEQGFTAQPGDRVRLNGYYEDGEFKVGLMENAASAMRVQLRTSTGAPMWAGAGWR